MPKGRGDVAVLRRGDDTIELGPDEVEAPNLPDEHSVINEWSFETPYNEDLEYYRHGELLLYFEDENGNRELDYRGPVDVVKSDDSTGRTRLRGRDVLADLERHGPESPIVADGIAWEEIDRVWNEIDGWDATVHPSEPEPVDSDRLVQQAETTTELEELFGDSIAADVPLKFENGDLKPTQIGFVVEAVDHASGTGEVIQGDEYSRGEAREVVDLADEITFDFELEYEMQDPIIGVRKDTRGEYENHLGFDYILDSEVIESIPHGSLTSSLDWFTVFAPGPLEPGTHSVEIDIDPEQQGDGEPFAIDLVAIVDGDYEDIESYNEVHEPGGYLDGPRELPPGVTAETIDSEITNNIVRAEVDASLNDTSNNQGLGVSFDSGETWFGTSNSEALDRDNEADPTVSVKGRVTLGATDSVRDKTPRTGFEPQTLSSWELRVDANDLAIYENEEYSGNWYQIIQEMHDDAGMIFRGVIDESSYLAESFVKGELTEEAEWTRLSFDRGYDVSDYANRLVVVGEPPDGSDRPVVIAESESEIERVGEVIPDYIDESESSRSTLRNIARVELSRRIASDQLAGSVEIVPRRLKAGYSYYVEAFGEESVLERQTFQDGKSPSCRNEFEDTVDISTAISSLRKEVRRGRR